MQIPIILINRNRLTTTEKLIDQLLLLGYSDITILDMASTYPPLLEFYDRRSSDFTVMYWDNTGHKALWEEAILKEHFNQYPWVAVTDSDIELNINTPKGFIEEMIVIAKDFRVDKVGLAIDYWNITNKFLANIIQPIEATYWLTKLKHRKREIYAAPVDTTFCVVRPELPFQYNAVRIGGNFTCKHIPWNENWDNLNHEQQYYMDTCDERIGTIKQHYLKWEANH